MTNKKASITITLLSSALLALLMLISARQGEPPIEPTPPTVNTEGLCHPVQVAAPSEPEQVMYYYTEDDARAVAQMLWGEARGCTRDNQIKCVWVVCNRVDDERFPDTIMGVLEQADQFHGYSPDYPVTDELYAVAQDVLTRWSCERQGAPARRELDSTYLWFTGNGAQNCFREEY